MPVPLISFHKTGARTNTDFGVCLCVCKITQVLLCVDARVMVVIVEMWKKMWTVMTQTDVLRDGWMDRYLTDVLVDSIVYWKIS